MRKLYFRIVFGVLVVLILAFSLPALIFNHPKSGEDGLSFAGPMTSAIALLKHRLENVEPTQMERELDSLKAFLDVPARLVDSGDVSLPRETKLRELAVTESSEGGRQTFFVVLQNTGKVLILGPTPGPPSPNTRSLLLLVAIVLVIAGVAGYLMIAPVVRNLRTLELATSRFGDGDLDSRAVVRQGDVVGSVARHFNVMASGIQRLIQRERQLLQSVSHELRTPIARIRFSLDMLDDSRTEEERRQRMQEIDDEICEIDQLVGELLDFNRMQSELTSLDLKMISVRPVLAEVVRRLRDFRPAVAVEIVSDDDGECTARVDRLLFRRAMQNLVSNALKYAKERVVISLSRGDSATLIEVCDDGPGVPAQRREQIMQPFVHDSCPPDRGRRWDSGWPSCRGLLNCTRVP